MFLSSSRKINVSSIFLFAALICVSPRGGANAVMQTPAGGSTCSDSIKNCKKPVKFISRDDKCYTFACEYGTVGQHNVHVSDATDVKTLLDLAK